MFDVTGLSGNNRCSRGKSLRCRQHKYKVAMVQPNPIGANVQRHRQLVGPTRAFRGRASHLILCGDVNTPTEHGETAHCPHCALVRAE
jgi:hypothetical protein